MINPAVRAIFFDAVGTLLFPEPPVAAIYAEVGGRHGSRLNSTQIGERFAAAFAREESADLAAGLRTSEERERRRWQHIVAAVLDDVVDVYECFRELYGHFAMPTAWRVDPAAAALLQQLHERGYRLGIASNFDHRLRSVAAGQSALHPVGTLLISSEVGWRKPAPEFFAAMSALVDLPPQQIMLIGDDPVSDQQGAIAAGMHALLLRNGLPLL